ncbi:putative phage tail protein [Ideonella paludis]|uniref:DUF2313 domain-containing protein n=1 Tax=Ideonella paludis TaxID=1233411 RepID=A0ABS5DUN2_9BURK|nr:putative phage tail protein [Ideonella paludis]MBQ0934581.1 DUF2313 domain-containing protein [Ideonella paludis]
MSTTPTVERFTQALAALLPTGWAWPRAESSTLMRVLRGLASAFAEHHAWAQLAFEQWLPHKTTSRLEEWEYACGLPDKCYGATQPYEDRRDRLLARLRGPTGAYADSSPAAPGALAALLADMGYTATVTYTQPFRFGRERFGARFGASGVLHVGVSGVTGTAPLDAAVIACALEDYIPARFRITITL